MRHLPSKYVKFPVALELPALDSERQAERAVAINQWKDSMGLEYNRDYVCFEHEEGRGFRARTVMAWAFRQKSHALQFKLTFGGWS